MAKKTCKCKEGAPEWMTTFADMVTLLLCFFVLIVSFSEIKKEDQFQAVIEEIKKAFGMHGGGGKLPTDDDPALSLIERLEAIRMRQEKTPNRSNTNTPGMHGREPRVTNVRPGTQFEVGGGVQFEPGSAELTDDAKASLRQLVDTLNLRGSTNKIELSGHAAARELMEPGADLQNAQARLAEMQALDELSHARAAAVKAYLISEEVGLDPVRFRTIGNGANEPINARAYTSGDARVNRRVSIVVTESVVEDYQQGEAAGPP